ncbi:MAG: alginate export family protein [Novosphingobium sp.]
MHTRLLFAATALTAPFTFSQAAQAAPGDPSQVNDALTFDPIIEGRLRYEHVDQPATEADAVTMRLRAGFELKSNGLAFLAEAEGTLAIENNYNAFPFAIASHQRRPGYSVVSDPENIELNRLQLQYKGKAATITLGRQRINLDDQRWVGSVGWRQNEQTFDAVRAEAKIGPVSLDGTYSGRQRTIFGIDAGPRQSYDGSFFFAGAGVKLGPVNVKSFAYLLDYNEAFFFANSSQTYGARATAILPLAPKIKLNFAASYARQSDYGSNPFHYDADYIAGEVGTTIAGFGLTAGYEKLGSDNGRALQTPLATLHKFDGWADLFLTTPNAGLQDYYGGASYKFDKVSFVKGMNAAVIYHRFGSDTGGFHYGSEWDASLGFNLKQFGVLVKYANYDARCFGLDTEKFWLQAEFKY